MVHYVPHVAWTCGKQSAGLNKELSDSFVQADSDSMSLEHRMRHCYWATCLLLQLPATSMHR
jgi:hypothetical protein